MSENSLPRLERLRSLRAIRRLFSEGKSGFVYPFRYNVLTYTDEESAAAEPVAHDEDRSVKIMFSVPKRFHKRANKRNLLKRRMREAYRLNRSSLVGELKARGIRADIALVYSTKECHSYKTVEHALQRIMEQVARNL
ncbi:MAG: ribonuclease P protein component [Alistipes sp.]|nr:ribonuclease P protein component [Alistipes sp.]